MYPTRFRLFSSVCRAPDDGTAAATAAPPAPAAPAPVAAAPAAAPVAVAAPVAPVVTPAPIDAAATTAPYRPEGLPDHLLGATERETIDKLAKAYGGAREAIAKAGEVPKDVSGYVFEAPEAVKPFAEALDGDPFWAKTKELSLKHGLSAKAFGGLFGDLMESMVKDGIVAEPFSAEKERAALVPDVTDPKERAATADRIVRENTALIDAWKAQGLPDDVATWLTSQMDRANANKLVDWIREGRGEQRPALGGVNTGGISEADLSARMADPRGDHSSPKYDPAFAAETTRLFRSHYGD